MTTCNLMLYQLELNGVKKIYMYINVYTHEYIILYIIYDRETGG